MTKMQTVVRDYDNYVLKTYTKTPLCLVKGKGALVWDAAGKRYLDFFPGWAVSGLGHCHPVVVRAIKKQAGRMLHVSNNYYNELQGRLAAEVSRNSFSGKVFFANSGAEANEGAIKLARAWGNGRSKFEIISMENSFHGRTLAAVTMTGQKKYSAGFGPLPRGFIHVKFNSLDAAARAISPRTAAIIVEPIQGEGGINVASNGYLRGLRALCDKKDLLLIFDEVQTGMGRTGRMFCYQHYGVEPDVMTLAKSLGGGLPIGALVASRKVSDVLKPGMHAATFGGSPIVCAAALAVFEAIRKEKLLNNTVRMGNYLHKKLYKLENEFDRIQDVRGIGLMTGVEFKGPCENIPGECMKKGLLINCTHGNVLRIMPPMTVTKAQIDAAIAILRSVLKSA